MSEMKEWNTFVLFSHRQLMVVFRVYQLVALLNGWIRKALLCKYSFATAEILVLSYYYLLREYHTRIEMKILRSSSSVSLIVK